MGGKRFSEEQIISVLKEAGMGLAELSRKYGICEGTHCNWKAKYGGMTGSEARKLKALEEENHKLKHIAADLMLDNQEMKAVLSKNF